MTLMSLLFTLLLTSVLIHYEKLNIRTYSNCVLTVVVPSEMTQSIDTQLSLPLYDLIIMNLSGIDVNRVFTHFNMLHDIIIHRVAYMYYTVHEEASIDAVLMNKSIYNDTDNTVNEKFILEIVKYLNVKLTVPFELKSHINWYRLVYKDRKILDFFLEKYFNTVDWSIYKNMSFNMCSLFYWSTQLNDIYTMKRTIDKYYEYSCSYETDTEK